MVVAAPRGFSINGDQFRGAIAKVLHPVLEANPEPVRVNRREHVAHRVVAGDPGLIGEKAAEEGLMLLSPERDFHEIIRPRDGCRQRQQEDFRQWIQYLRTLAWVSKSREMGQDRAIDGLGLGGLQS